ncbi:MAG: hypothetical protein LIP23_01980, partial [Planctomycetes bacterium]|nr:hypothetical protein [Planctomycetota bacterium]
GGLAQAAQSGPRTMGGWFNVTTPDGWRGKRFVEGEMVFAEEFDSNGDGRMDVWRFYRDGILSSEERDLNGDGRVDYQSRWDPYERRLLMVLRDTTFTGCNDLEIEAQGRQRWEIREDRNRDNITDRILIVNGPPDLFDRLGIDLYLKPNVIDAIPLEFWYELSADDGFTGYITDYRRFNRGNLSQVGEWNGRQVVWRRAPRNYQPPVAAPVAVQPVGPTDQVSMPVAVDPAGAPIGDLPAPTYTEGQFGPPVLTEPVSPQPYTPPPLDRTQYEGMPPGESAARSLPARMRPPGVGRRQ